MASSRSVQPRSIPIFIVNIFDLTMWYEVPITCTDPGLNPNWWNGLGASWSLIGLLFSRPLYFSTHIRKAYIIPWVTCEHLEALLHQHYDVSCLILWPALLVFPLGPHYSRKIYQWKIFFICQLASSCMKYVKKCWYSKVWTSQIYLEQNESSI